MEYYSARLRTAETAASPAPILAFSGICDKIQQRAAEVILGRIDMPNRGRVIVASQPKHRRRSPLGDC
jgi:hypothetical protein